MRPIRAIVLLAVSFHGLPIHRVSPSAQPDADALGVVLEALEAGQALDVRAESSECLGGEADVVGAGCEVAGAQSGGPDRSPAGGQGVRGTGPVVREPH